MLEIFIPRTVKGYRDINTIHARFFSVLHTHFPDICIEDFSSKFFTGVKIISKEFDERLLIICNGEFGEKYFVNFDYIKYTFDCLGCVIISQKQIEEKMKATLGNMSDIVKSLQSNKLLTLSKKKQMHHRIDMSIFTVSGIVFSLYQLKMQSDQNQQELQGVIESGENASEYTAPAALLQKTSQSKKDQLTEEIDKLESHINTFLPVINSLL